MTLLTLALLLRGRFFFSVTFWWELGYATPTGGATVLTLLVLLLLAGLPPFPTFFAKLGMLSYIYGRGGWGILALLLCSIGVGWLAYVGAMLLLLGGGGLVLCQPWFSVVSSLGLKVGFVFFALLWSMWGLADVTTILRWLWV